jgi:hypothetical protein
VHSGFDSLQFSTLTNIERIRIPESNKLESYLQVPREEHPLAPENEPEEVPAAILQLLLEKIESPPRHSKLPTIPSVAPPDKWAT